MNPKYLPFLFSGRAMGVITGRIPILYGDEASPPVRFVMMTASFLGVKYHFKRIDLFSGENKSEFYTQINPLQKVPALELESEHVIRDSHAIGIYLCHRVKNNRSLYPLCIDIESRSKVDEMLFFNSSTLFPIDSAIFSDFFSGKWPVEETLLEKWNSSLDYLNNILTESPWLAGETMRLCDICCGATVSSLRLLVPSTDSHPKVNEWIEKLNNYDFFDINAKGLDRLQSFIDAAVTKQSK